MKAFWLILDLLSLVILPISAFMIGANNFDYLFPLSASLVGLMWSLFKLHRRSAL